MQYERKPHLLYKLTNRKNKSRYRVKNTTRNSSCVFNEIPERGGGGGIEGGEVRRSVRGVEGGRGEVDGAERCVCAEQ